MTITEPTAVPSVSAARPGLSFKQAVGNRRSIRFFKPYQPVEKTKIQKILEAARLQSQHGNASLIRKAVVVYRDEIERETFDALCTALYNQPAAAQAPVQIYWTIDMSGWEVLKDNLLELIDVGALTSSYGWSERFIKDIVLKTPDFNVMAGDRTFAEWLSAIETGMAMGIALLAAVDEGLGTALLTGQRAKIGELLGMPETTTVCHFPPGTSKWNKIEHRLFAQITTNWRGRPLTSHEVVVASIAATTTRTGLRVHAELDPARYDLGLTLTQAQLAALPITRHDWHGDWNYTLAPQPTPDQPTPSTPTDRWADPTDLAWLAHPALTGVSAEEFDALARLLAARPERGKPLIPITGRLTAALVQHHTYLPLRDLATLYGVHPATFRFGQTITTLREIGRLPHRGPLHLANLNDLDDITALYDIPHRQDLTASTPTRLK